MSDYTTKPLDDAVSKALGVSDAAFVVAVDKAGKVVLFEREGTTDAAFPIDTKRVENVYTATFFACSGSNCVYYVDSTGTLRCICF